MDASGRPTILIVDDEAFNVSVLEQELEDLGYATLSAADGAQALQQIARHAPDVVLLDMMMPVLDGFAVLERLKADPATRELAVIVISAAHDLGRVARAIELGAEDYLPKPFEPVLLRARLEACLDRKRRRDRELAFLEQVSVLTAAAQAVEVGTFEPLSLSGVAARPDALGRLAGVFTQMAAEVRLREARLQRQLTLLERDRQNRREAAADTVAAYLPMDRRQALARGEALPAVSSGSVLLADVSGFTALTGTLARELGWQRGAEEIVAQLNLVFGALIDELHRFGGSAVSFAGDAVTCWFAGDDGRLALTCALAMARAALPFAALRTPGGAPGAVAIKVAVAAGETARRLVGDPQARQFEVLLGTPVRQAGQGEQLAGPGEVLAHEGVARSCGADLSVVAWRTAPNRERFAVIASTSAPTPERPWPELPAGALPADLARPWLLPEVYEQVCAGRSEFLSELRRAAALFVGFSGLGERPGENETAGQRLDAFTRWAQGVLVQHGGCALQLTPTDDGAYLYATFGVPLAHQDDVLRALAAALELQQPPTELSFLRGLRTGLSYGTLRAGAYGGAGQRTYGAQGDSVNLAARLMQASDAGLLCDEEVYQAARSRLEFGEQPSVLVKGKASPVRVYRPLAPTLRGALDAHLDHLPAAAQLTLKVASVLGDVFPLNLLLAVHPGGVGASDLRPLTAVGLLEARAGAAGEEYGFGAFSLRRQVYERLLFAQRRHLHRLAAEWYERHHAADLTPHLSVLSHHWERAEQPDQAARYLEQAAQHARTQGDHHAAWAALRGSLALEPRSAGSTEAALGPAKEEPRP